MAKVSNRKHDKKGVVSTSFTSSGTSSAVPSSYAPAPWYGLPLLILLPLLSVAGFFGTWILSGSNGTIAMMEALAKENAPLLPGSTDLLLKTYTGIAPIDKQLTVLVTFFAPVLDPKNGSLILFSVFGLGQFGGAWTLMMMESLRMGNKGTIVSFVGTAGFILQNITFTVTVPLWLSLHILTSPIAKLFPGSHASSLLLISTLDLKILPGSVILGYIVPSILMALPSPSVTSPLDHQKYIALWQPFPVWCVLIHMSIRYVCNIVGGTASEDASKDQQTSLETSYLKFAWHVYRFIIGLCLITHLPPLLISILPPTTFPDTTPMLRSLFKHSFAEVYLPYFPTLAHQVPNFATGVHVFLQWDMYIGGAAMLLWGIFLHGNVTTKNLAIDPDARGNDRMIWMKTLGKIGFWTLLAGPMGALAVLLWERDAIVKQKVKQGV